MDILVKLLGIIAGAGISLIIIGSFLCVLALPVMLLWNWLMPGLFGFPTLSFLQAIGLQFLCGLLLRPSLGISKTQPKKG